ncbi:glycosyltransferase family 2 protein, partial [Gammaproteobacteria bacterium]|nr:glycosyltransferase family 2 protein [Gammaproteobacteria bacterium]
FAIDCHPNQKSIKYLKDHYADLHAYDYQGNLGYAAGNNYLVKKAYENGYEVAVISNTDVILDPDCFNNMKCALLKPYSLVSPLLYYGSPKKPKGLHSYGEKLNMKSLKVEVVNGRDTDISILPDFKETNIVTGCLFMFNIKSFIAIGLFNEDGFMYGEEVDLALKFKEHGLRMLCVKNALAWHNHREKDKRVLFDTSYYYIKRNFILLCVRVKKFSALRSFLLLELIKIPKIFIIGLYKKDIKSLFYYYKGIMDGLKGVKGRKDNL